jgi:hypothetical protein
MRSKKMNMKKWILGLGTLIWIITAITAVDLMWLLLGFIVWVNGNKGAILFLLTWPAFLLLSRVFPREFHLGIRYAGLRIGRWLGKWVK